MLLLLASLTFHSEKKYPDDAAFNLAASHTVRGQLVEVGHIGGCGRHREGVGRVSGNLRTILCPVSEGIASVGCGSQGA